MWFVLNRIQICFLRRLGCFARKRIFMEIPNDSNTRIENVFCTAITTKCLVFIIHYRRKSRLRPDSQRLIRHYQLLSSAVAFVGGGTNTVVFGRWLTMYKESNFGLTTRLFPLQHRTHVVSTVTLVHAKYHYHKTRSTTIEAIVVRRTIVCMLSSNQDTLCH